MPDSAPSVPALLQVCWRWVHGLALEAVAVAVAWFYVFGQMTGERLQPGEAVCLGTAVWLIYMGDRIGDAAAGAGTRERHRFAARHRRWLLPVMVAAGAGALWWALHFMRWGTLRAALVVVVTTAIVIVGLGYRWISAALITLASDVFDKDPTLTGRTYLWYRASDLIAEKPALGRGYFAFWLQGNIDAEGLWRYAGIRSRSGFTFHNAAVEILVGLGYVGLAVIGTAVLIAAVVREPTPVLAFWLVILLYELSRAPIESVGMTPFYHSTVLVFAALGAAFGKRATSWVAPGPAGKPVSFRAAPYEESRANAALSIPHAGGSMRLRQPADQAPLQPR